ncbi:hypothetical protein SteCoe_12146 [Stentor coeruleus]|uniref:Uncharacterized protein n=1 Tax=Stentor coeruleus TaxID=5963 RepID=A0A1R2CBG9_9CILI|nr:hypothetical protein SteCoe_12146 [Stentor coeruleus]
MSTGTAGFLTVGEYLRSRSIGLQFSETQTKNNTLPNTPKGWQEMYVAYQKSKRAQKKESILYEEYKKQKKTKWIAKNTYPKNILYMMFPYANPAVDNFKKIYTLNINQSTFENIINILVISPILLFRKNIKLSLDGFTMPMIIFGSIGTLFVKISNLITEDRIENYLSNTNQGCDPRKMFLFTFSSVSLYVCSMYFGVNFINPLAVAAVKAEEIALAKVLFKQYSAIILSSILVSSCSSYLKAAKNFGEANDIEKKPILIGNMNVNVDENTIKKTKWGLQLLTYLIFISMINSSVKGNLSNPMFKNPDFALFLYFLATGSELFNNYKSGTGQFSDFMIKFMFMTSTIIGFSGFRIMSKTILK